MSSKLQSAFLDAQGPAAKSRVFVLAAELAGLVRPWVLQHPIIRDVRVDPLSLTLAASAPFCSAEALATAIRGTLWIFTYDDFLDEELVPIDVMLNRTKDYQRMILDRGEGNVDDPLAVLLQSVRYELSRNALFEPLHDVWADAFANTLDGMLAEHQWRCRYKESGVLPTHDEYMRSAMWSVGAALHFFASAITIEDRSIIDSLTMVREMALAASRAIRFANDLRSYPKEMEEQNVNSVVLAHAKIGGSLAEAESDVREKIVAELRLCDELTGVQCTETGLVEKLISNTAHFSCEFYESHDFHVDI